jgi:hypothetical protein
MLLDPVDLSSSPHHLTVKSLWNKQRQDLQGAQGVVLNL